MKKYVVGTQVTPEPPQALPPVKPPAPAVTGIPGLLPDERGFEWLEEHDGVVLRQTVALTPLNGCEPTTRLMLAPLAYGAELPDELSASWALPVRAAMDAEPVLHAREYGSCTDRVCCPLTRGFVMDFADAHGAPYFTVVRPSAFEPCGCWPLFFTRAQALSILDRKGELVARAIEPVKVCGACWTRSFVTVDTMGEPVYTLKASECGSQAGCNWCAPSCFNESYDVDVYAPDGGLVGAATWVWPGCACGNGVTDRSNIVIRFPRGSTAEHRLALIGGVLLVEYTSMELKRLQEGTGGSAGAPRHSVKTAPGGAPANVEMER